MFLTNSTNHSFGCNNCYAIESHKIRLRIRLNDSLNLFVYYFNAVSTYFNIGTLSTVGLDYTETDSFIYLIF